MKRLRLSALLIVLSVSALAAQTDGWKNILKPDYNYSLYDAYFFDANTGWVVGDSGLVLKSTNGGVSWAAQNSGTNIRLRKAFFISEKIGWIAAERRSVLRTTDGGVTWSTVKLPVLAADSAKITYSISFVDAAKGWAVCGKSTAADIFVTSDSGKTWTSQKAILKPFYDISFANARCGATVGADFTALMYTTDGGTTWSTSAKPDFGGFNYTASVINSVVMIDSMTVIATGWGSWFQMQPTMIFRSVDGGKTYAYVSQAAEKRAYGSGQEVYFKDKNNGLLVGGQRGGILLKTTDGGMTWIQQSPQFGSPLYGITGIGDKVWAVTRSGLIYRSSDFGATWQTSTKHGGDAIQNVSFVSAKNGYMVTSNSIVKKTTDGGATWNSVGTIGTGIAVDGILAAQFVSDNVGFAGQEYGNLQKTIDGGKTWNVVLQGDSGSQSGCRALHFLNESVGFAARSMALYDADEFVKTTNGGGTISVRDTATKKQPRSIQFFDVNRGIIGANSGVLRYTKDGGATWNTPVVTGHPAGISATGTIYAIDIVDSANTWLVGSKFIYKSADLGKTWTYVAHGIAGIDTTFYGIGFKDAQTGYVVGYKGLVLKTTNGGASWTQIKDIPSTESLYGPAFDLSGGAWIYSASGNLYSNSAATSVENVSSAVPTACSLEQNYPNPFNPSTVFRF